MDKLEKSLMKLKKSTGKLKWTLRQLELNAAYDKQLTRAYKKYKNLNDSDFLVLGKMYPIKPCDIMPLAKVISKIKKNTEEIR